MIFLTVGTQLPFDRLTTSVDAWSAEAKRDIKVFGQIGCLGPENYRPQHFEWVEMVAPDAFDEYVQTASLIISHAGMGSIITAISSGKPIIVLPRRAHLGEQRSDHQFATAQRLGTRQGVFTVMTEVDLPDLIARVLAQASSGSSGTLSPFADERLLEAVRNFIQNPDGT